MRYAWLVGVGVFLLVALAAATKGACRESSDGIHECVTELDLKRHIWRRFCLHCGREQRATLAPWIRSRTHTSPRGWW